MSCCEARLIFPVPVAASVLVEAVRVCAVPVVTVAVLALWFSATVCLRPISVLVSAVAITVAVLIIAVALVTEVIGVSLLSPLVLWSTRFLCGSASRITVLPIAAILATLVVSLIVSLAIRSSTGIIGARLGFVVTRASVRISWFVVWCL